MLSLIFNANLYEDRLESLVPTVGTAVLRSAWVEPDSNVHGAMWQPLLMFLKRKTIFPPHITN